MAQLASQLVLPWCILDSEPSSSGISCKDRLVHGSCALGHQDRVHQTQHRRAVELACDPSQLDQLWGAQGAGQVGSS